MSFLAGRLAGKEGAFFFQESKHAVNRLVEKTATASAAKASPSVAEADVQADVLPEVLKHSLPPKLFGRPSDSSSLSNSASKWWVSSTESKSGSVTVSPDALNPLRAYVSLPQVTFGPKRWDLPSAENTVMASTANELRKDKNAPMSPEKLKAAAEGFKLIGKAFAVATLIVFGGATVILSTTLSRLKVQNSDDLQTKGRDLLHPKVETIREQLIPIRNWAENKSKKWHLERQEDIKESPVIKELSRILGAKTSS